ncbi:hypothetical protein [Blastococcus deserti]|uniref:Lipoprotein n=1 Tax=Blastococcus deserti TaxID=2259033 RepID=A0ABW4X662_9ACTN
MRRCLVALAGLLAAACGTTASPTASSSTPGPAVPAVPGMEAEAVRLRTDEAVGGRFQVRLAATGGDVFTVTSVALDSPGFGALPATAVTAEFALGRVIDLPTPYGPPQCDADPWPAAARLTVVRPGGAAEPVRVPLSGDVLATVHEEECAEQAIAEVVEVTVADLADDGDAVTGLLTLTRRAGEERVAATALGRSVLLEVVAEELPLELPAGERSVTTAVSFTPASCHPHVLAETKKPYVFPLTVEVEDVDPVSVDLPLDQGARDRLAALVQRVCGATN